MISIERNGSNNLCLINDECYRPQIVSFIICTIRLQEILSYVSFLRTLLDYYFRSSEQYYSFINHDSLILVLNQASSIAATIYLTINCFRSWAIFQLYSWREQVYKQIIVYVKRCRWVVLMRGGLDYHYKREGDWYFVFYVHISTTILHD